VSNVNKDILVMNIGGFTTTNNASPKRINKWIIPIAAFVLPSILAISGASAQAGSFPGKDSQSLLSSSSYSERWTGFYFGASVGGGWGNSSTFYDRAGDDHPTTETNDPSGYLASLTIGYNQQLGNNFVIGIEGDLGVMNFTAPDKLDMWDGHIWKSQYGGLWGTLRPRVGYTFDDVLIYGTAGLAMMETNEVILGDNDATQNTYNQGIHTGWVFGGGVEFALSDSLSTKVEYLQMQFPEYTSYTNNEEKYGFTNSAALVRVGVNSKF